MRHSYQATLGACFTGYIVQSVINLFAPLLFLTFQREFSLSLDQIALLITVNFLVQLCVDGLSARFVDKIGWRICMVAAHLCLPRAASYCWPCCPAASRPWRA